MTLNDSWYQPTSDTGVIAPDNAANLPLLNLEAPIPERRYRVTLTVQGGVRYSSMSAVH